jgi:diguanylate cyclase
MNRSDSQIGQSNRPASRRLHRRPAASGQAHCVSAQVASPAPAVATLSLPTSVVQDAGMFELLAARMRIAELEDELFAARAAACTDPLTGALNRRGFERACQRELARARRRGAGLALVHIDLDDFKQLNDSLGHQAGDAALVRLVAVLHGAMRPSDVLCRFGGEEFVMSLPDCGLHEASAAISRFLQEFSAEPIPGTNRYMSFSAGVVVQGADESLDEAIARADAATYAAKRAGKNRVVIA